MSVGCIVLEDANPENIMWEIGVEESLSFMKMPPTGKIVLMFAIAVRDDYKLESTNILSIHKTFQKSKKFLSHRIQRLSP